MSSASTATERKDDDKEEKSDGVECLSPTPMLTACESGDLKQIQSLIQQDSLYRSLQDNTTGKSPLMVASAKGHLDCVKLLLNEGAPWNAIDRRGQCAGDYATTAEHWDIVNFIVDFATKAELVLGAAIRANGGELMPKVKTSVEEEPCTKPDYLQHRLQFTSDAILDSDQDAVMMEWERPLMEAHAQIMMENSNNQTVMNIGFGMGIIDGILQDQHKPKLHVIVEAHPDVYQKMVQEGWTKKPNVRVEFGKWQDVLPKLVKEGITLDAIFYDTYGEHFLDLEDFHQYLPKLLSPTTTSIYSFFNGLAPDNLFFHGVACQCVKVQLEVLGLEVEFLPCQIQAPETEVWEGVRRKYWHGRDTYYLPRATWKKEDQTQAIQKKRQKVESK